MDNTERLEKQIKELNTKVDDLTNQIFSIIGLLQEQNYLTIANNNLAPNDLRIDAFNRAMDIASIPEYKINNAKEEDSLRSSFR